MYNLHQSTSIHLINTLIFASSCIFGLALFAFQVFPAQTRHNDFQVMVLIIPLVEAGRDIFAIYIVQREYCSLFYFILSFTHLIIQ